MDFNTVQALANVYNNLLRVKTSGEDSFIMTDNLRSLFGIIKQQAELLENQNKEVGE